MKSAFLTGKVQNSAYRRLKIAHGIVGNENEVNMKERAWKLIEKAQNGELDNIRVDIDEDLFRTFVNICLIALSNASVWRYKSYTNVLSEIFTASDEALAMLMLENNAADLMYVYDNQKVISRKESRPKYTKGKDNKQDSFRGWHKKGILRYNELYTKIKNLRQRQTCLSRELALRDEYAKICGKLEGGMNGIGILSDSEDEDNDESYVQAIDGFDGTMPNLDIVGDDGVPVSTNQQAI